MDKFVDMRVRNIIWRTLKGMLFPVPMPRAPCFWDSISEDLVYSIGILQL